MIEHPKLRLFLREVSLDQLRALKGLTVITVLRSNAKARDEALEENEFLFAIDELAEDQMFMALARMIDEDRKKESVTVERVCCYAENNRPEFTWLFSEAGRSLHPQGNTELTELCKKWRSWFESEPLLPKVRALRTKFLAHRDKALVLGRYQMEQFERDEITDLIVKLGEFVNDFQLFVEGNTIGYWTVYERLFKEGASFLAVQRAMELLLQEPENQSCLWTKTVAPEVEKINAAHLNLTSKR